MTIEYQNTPEDLRETLLVATREQTRASRLARTILLVVVVAGIFMGDKFLMQTMLPADADFFLLNSFIAAIIFVIMIFLFSLIRIVGTKNWRGLWNILILLAVLGFLVGEWALVSLLPGSVGLPTASQRMRILIPHIPWISMLVLLQSLLLFLQFRNQKLLWIKNPMLQRPKSAEIVASGITINDALAQMEYQWAAFTKCRETKNLFLLFLGSATYLMIPKRAFATAEELSAMRAMSQMAAPPGPHAFTIQPVDRIPPLPPPMSNGP